MRGRRQEPLKVIVMALALATAATAGAVIGIAWQAFSGSDEEQAEDGSDGELSADPEGEDAAQ